MTHFAPAADGRGDATEDDGKTWRLTLRDGLMFHDGTKVLARDAAASVRRWGTRDAFGQALMAATDEITAPDDRTMVFRLKDAVPAAARRARQDSPSMCPIMPERLAATDPFKQVTEMVGSGPFRLRRQRTRARLARRLRAFRGLRAARGRLPQRHRRPKIVHFDRVEWQFIPDAGTVAAALQRARSTGGSRPAPICCRCCRRAPA